MRKISKLPTILSIIALSFASLACDISDIKDGRLIPFLTVDWKNRAFLVAFHDPSFTEYDKLSLESYLRQDPPKKGTCDSFMYYGDTITGPSGEVYASQSAFAEMCGW